jgi:hypothetical protein
MSGQNHSDEINKIQSLKTKFLSDLDKVYDYYNETKEAWQIIQSSVRQGMTFEIKNSLTGSVTDQDQLAAKARDYVAYQLSESTFQQVVTIFEAFFFDLLRIWLQANPNSLNSHKIDAKTILEQPDKDSIVDFIIEKELNEIKYKRISEWFDHLDRLIPVKKHFVNHEIDKLAEIRASRDILVHAQGIVGSIYKTKVGHFARYQEGEQLEISELYLIESWTLTQAVITQLGDILIQKLSKQNLQQA